MVFIIVEGWLRMGECPQTKQQRGLADARPAGANGQPASGRHAPRCAPADARSAGCRGGLAALPRPSQWAEEWADGWSACEGEGKGGVKGWSSRAEVREKVRGEYRFISLMKQKKKGNFTSSFTSPDFFLIFFSVMK